MSGHSKDWFHVRGGKKLSILRPDPRTYPVVEMIKAIGSERRYSNQIDEHLSVAGHSVLVHDILKEWGASDEERIQGLLHDIPEGATRDVSSPLAHQPDMWFYRKVGDIHLKALCDRFGVSHPISDLVHQADKAACRLETEALIPDRHPDWDEWLKEYPDASGLGLKARDYVGWAIYPILLRQLQLLLHGRYDEIVYSPDAMACRYCVLPEDAE